VPEQALHQRGGERGVRAGQGCRGGAPFLGGRTGRCGATGSAPGASELLERAACVSSRVGRAVERPKAFVGVQQVLPVGGRQIRVGDGGGQLAQAHLEAGAPLGRVERLGVALAREQRLGERLRGGELVSQRGGAGVRRMSSGSWPPPRRAKRKERPGWSSGRARSIALCAARRPAASPSKQRVGSPWCFQRSAICSSVRAVPSGATAATSARQQAMASK
jgi:hypothetical protein